MTPKSFLSNFWGSHHIGRSIYVISYQTTRYLHGKKDTHILNHHPIYTFHTFELCAILTIRFRNVT